MQTRLTRCDYEDFLIRVYFGETVINNSLKACVDRAYLDFSRTVRGIGKCSKRKQIYEGATCYLISRIENLENTSQKMNQCSFDDWHKETCIALRAMYKNVKFNNFRVGQFQKWLNMIFKYIFTLDEKRISGFQPLYRYCHVPFDNIVVSRLKPYKFHEFSQPWSRVDDYDEYIERQKWIRMTFSIIPLDLEFLLWIDSHFVPTPTVEAGKVPCSKKS